MDRTLYWLWLAEALGSACRYTGELLAEWPDPRDLDRAVRAGQPLPACVSPKAAEKLRAVRPEHLRGLLDYCSGCGIAVLTPQDPQYPDRLRDLPDLPPVLYVTGDPACLNGRRYVGMVGTRRPTRYGANACHDLSLALAQQGVVIVSGLADGLDGVGHRAAVEAGAPTVAFLGTAINRTYPAANKPLRAELERLGGAVASEYPPDYTGKATGTFLARNRLIAGLSEAVCVAEARASSGTMNTVEHAERYGRPVFAVPGSIYSATSEGTNELLRTHRAEPLCRAGDILQALGMTGRDPDPVRRTPAFRPQDLSPGARAVLAALGPAPQTADELVNATGLPVQTVLAALTELEILDAAAPQPGGRYTAAV
ncbi:DNA-processing protein DprA [bacterium]|nr:DNA-processing protein DprA [bacterium]MCI7745323.1 DNA-processing protein DprA [bacterium]